MTPHCPGLFRSCLVGAVVGALASSCTGPTQASEGRPDDGKPGGKADGASPRLAGDPLDLFVDQWGAIACDPAAFEARLTSVSSIPWRLSEGSLTGGGSCEGPYSSSALGTDFLRCQYHGEKNNGISETYENANYFYYCSSETAKLVGGEYVGSIATPAGDGDDFRYDDETWLVNGRHASISFNHHDNPYFFEPLWYQTIKGDGRLVGGATFAEPSSTKLIRVGDSVVIVSAITNSWGYNLAVFEKDRVAVRLVSGSSQSDVFPPDMRF